MVKSNKSNSGIDLSDCTNVSQFADKCFSQYGDRVAFESAYSTMTYTRASIAIDHFAAWLHSIGVKRGDRVALMMPNSMQYPVCLFAVLRVGAVVVNVNPLYTVPELAHQLSDSGASVIVALENFADKVEKVIDQSSLQTVVLTQIGDLLEPGMNIKGAAVNFFMRHVNRMVPPYSLPNAVWLKQALKKGAKLAKPEIDPPSLSDIAFLQYTGGTTGKSKGAILTHGNILANCRQALERLEGHWSPDEAEKIVSLLPLYHVYSLVANCLVYIALGGINILVANPRDTKRVVGVIRRSKFTAISGVNTLFQSLLDDSGFKTVDFSNLKFTLSGGTALHERTAQRWKELTGMSIVQAYGLTECSPIVTTPHLDNLDSLPVYQPHVGSPVIDTQIVIRDDKDQDLETGSVGEICVKGPQVMQGYWNAEAETRNAFTDDGWLKTGDLGYLSEDNLLYIVDRSKDMINVSGFNVYPNEIENALCLHPQIIEACVVAHLDDSGKEQVKAVLHCHTAEIDPSTLKNHCIEYLARYKIPTIYVFEKQPLIKTPAGKILRREYKEAIQDSNSNAVKDAS